MLTNPPTLHENISALERLLDHNPKARIVWLHAGWDLTGERTVVLMRSLLARHTNLYMSIKMDPQGMPTTAPLERDGQLKPGWAALLRAFPDRFVIGSDQFFDDARPGRLARARRIVDALPPDAAQLIAVENVKHIYHVPILGP
jgi:predicted TIM-barrel fold metal-dependent hydrolase